MIPVRRDGEQHVQGKQVFGIILLCGSRLAFFLLPFGRKIVKLSLTD
jgi:hypothetical protein